MQAPTVSAAFTAWTWQPVALLAVAAALGWWLRGPRRPLFLVGVVALAYATCGFPGAYADALFRVWTVQQLALLLVVPYLLLAGAPELLMHPRVRRLLDTRVARTVANPLVGPALVPLLSIVLFFGPLPGWCIAVPPVGWLEQVLLVAVGALLVVPLVDPRLPRSSLAVGLGLGIGSFELVLDALPGIALRLHNRLSTSWFDHRSVFAWSPDALHDQRAAGAVLWCVAELLDLPFLVLVFRQWLRVDARDAADADAVLEAERAARGGAEPVEGGLGPSDAPWWLADADLSERLRRQPPVP